MFLYAKKKHGFSTFNEKSHDLPMSQLPRLKDARPISPSGVPLASASTENDGSLRPCVRATGPYTWCLAVECGKCDLVVSQNLEPFQGKKNQCSKLTLHHFEGREILDIADIVVKCGASVLNLPCLFFNCWQRKMLINKWSKLNNKQGD